MKKISAHCIYRGMALGMEILSSWCTTQSLFNKVILQNGNLTSKFSQGFQNCLSLRCSLSYEPLNSPLPNVFHTVLSHSFLFKFFTIIRAHSHSLVFSSCQTTFKLSQFLLRPGVNQHSSTTDNISVIIYAH